MSIFLMMVANTRRIASPLSEGTFLCYHDSRPGSISGRSAKALIYDGHRSDRIAKRFCFRSTKMGHQDRLSPVLTAPMRSTVPNLVYAANGSEVRIATVVGKVLVRDREVFTADEDAICAEAQVQAERAA